MARTKKKTTKVEEEIKVEETKVEEEKVEEEKKEETEEEKLMKEAIEAAEKALNEKDKEEADQKLDELDKEVEANLEKKIKNVEEKIEKMQDEIWKANWNPVHQQNGFIRTKNLTSPIPMYQLPADLQQYLKNKCFWTDVYKKDKEWLEKHHADMNMIEKLKKFISERYN